MSKTVKSSLELIKSVKNTHELKEKMMRNALDVLVEYANSDEAKKRITSAELELFMKNFKKGDKFRGKPVIKSGTHCPICGAKEEGEEPGEENETPDCSFCPEGHEWHIFEHFEYFIKEQGEDNDEGEA